MLYLDTGYGLGRSFGDCKPALPNGRKFENTKWLKHKLRATSRGQQFEQTDGGSWFPFPLRFVRAQLEFVTQAFGDSPKLSSSEIMPQMWQYVIFLSLKPTKVTSDFILN